MSSSSNAAAAAALPSPTPMVSQIDDMEASMTSHGFVSGTENLWVPEHGWTDRDCQAGDDVHSPQYMAALDTFLRFFALNKVWVHLAASMQAGKTGVVNALVRLMMVKANFTKIGIPPTNIFLLTGMSDNSWKKQTRERMPSVLHENIQHAGGLTRVKAQLIKRAKDGYLKNILIVIDESHFASSKMNQTSKHIYTTLRELCPIEEWGTNNIRILTISATDPSLILAAGTMRETASVVHLQVTDAYQGIRSLLEAGRIHKTFDLESEKSVQKLIQFIHDTYGATPLYHIIRPRTAKLSIVSAALTKLVPSAQIINWDASSNAARADSASVSSTESMEDINTLLTTPPTAPTFILLKNMFYASKTMKDPYVGVLYDRSSAKDDTNLQSLLGRACGYGKSSRTHIFTTMSTVENWLDVWEKLCPRTGFLSDKEAKALDKKMAGLKAISTNNGCSLHITQARATPLHVSSVSSVVATTTIVPDKGKANEDDFEHSFAEFANMADAKFPYMRTPKMDADGFYLTSTTSSPKKQSYTAINVMCKGKKTAGLPWGSLDVGDSVKRLYVGYKNMADPTSCVWVVRTLKRIR
jgi:hypothetical protein